MYLIYENCKKIALGTVFFALCFFPIFAHGKNDKEAKTAENYNAYAESFDLTGRKKGTYNIYVTADDFGGNRAMQGPFNIKHDPKSDLPVLNITNPVKNIRITGNLNIVGSCIDDDGVDYVELVLDDDAENPIRAKGKEFWSYYLDTKNLAEGLHKIQVTGIDINGLRGNPVTVNWHLDRRLPVSEMENYGMGMLVSGNVKFHGTVSDGNGIKSFEYSNDGGKTFAPARIKTNKKEGTSSFDISVSTKKIEDGPAVLWLKAKDNAGSVGLYSFLYFVDNSAPDVKIVFPTDSDTLAGQFFVAGYAKDAVGLESLSWKLGNETGEIELIPGNPYWTVPFDTNTMQASSFSITARDRAGNVTSASQRLNINNASNMPVLTITEPLGKIAADNTDEIFLRGFAKDNNGVQSISYSLDGADPVAVKTQGAFCVKLAEALALAPGKHTVSITALDINGVSSAVKKADFQVLAPAFNEDTLASLPKLTLDGPTSGSWVKTSMRLTGTASDDSGIQTIEYSLDGGAMWEPLPLASQTRASATFNTDISLSLIDDGFIKVDVRVFNKNGGVSYKHAAVIKDSEAPSAIALLPAPEDVVNGKTTVAIAIKDAGGLDKAYFIPSRGNRQEVPIAPLIVLDVGTPNNQIGSDMRFEVRDRAGNVTTLSSWDFRVDAKADIPKTEIHLPQENELITRDFTISGVVYDDDGPCTIYYRIDKNKYVKLPETGTSFAIDVPLSVLGDNEHSISMYSVDVNGVESPEVTRNFRVSLEEPKATVATPTIDTVVKDTITFTGAASDKNGIANVQISLDNGASYNNVEGTTTWKYTVDTRALPSGTQVVFIKAIDNYGVQGLYSSIVSIDNIAPTVYMEMPVDGAKTSGMLFISGYAFDNMNLENLYADIRSLERKPVGAIGHVTIAPDRIIGKTLDLSSLQDGIYNVELAGEDKAGNVTRISRNIELTRAVKIASVDILYPLDGETKQGSFKIYGQATAENTISSLTLYIDGKNFGTTELTPTGFFMFDVTPDVLSEGTHGYKVVATIENGKRVSSRTQNVVYSKTGPWVEIDNFMYGDFAKERPIIRGQAGYSISTAELDLLKSKEITKEQKKTISNKAVKTVELSFDNGKTFKKISSGKKWKYRIENQDIAEGYHFMLVKATMKNGETAITRTVVQIDRTSPFLKLVDPASGGRYNQELLATGLASDNVGLTDVQLVLRKGGKGTWEVPTFFKGLHFDAKIWGATLYQIGVGLSFFDDAVKVQMFFGQFTQTQREIFVKNINNMRGRYGGNVLTAKILANIGTIEFGKFAGHDFDWLAMNFALGADFSYFTQTQSGKAQILSALIGQIEFPRVTIAKAKYFRTFAFYFETAIWFIPTDVIAATAIKSIIPQFAGGFRINVF